MHVFVCLYMRVREFMRTCVLANLRMRAYVCVQACVRACRRGRAYVCVCASMRVVCVNFTIPVIPMYELVIFHTEFKDCDVELSVVSSSSDDTWRPLTSVTDGGQPTRSDGVIGKLFGTAETFEMNTLKYVQPITRRRSTVYHARARTHATHAHM